MVDLAAIYVKLKNICLYGIRKAQKETPPKVRYKNFKTN